MNTKNATLVGMIGAGIGVLLQLFGIMEIGMSYAMYQVLGLASWGCIFFFFVVLFMKQNKGGQS